jgi:AcrR family transcriptional regulator
MTDTAEQSTERPTERPTELGRRERKKLETFRALRSAALRLAAERGPDQVSVEEIADAADVSVRTFFNYFSSKEEAIIGWDPDWLDNIAARVVERPAREEPFAALRAVIRDMVDGVEEWADQRAIRHRLVRENPSLQPGFLAAHHQLEQALVRGLAERLGEDAGGSLYSHLVVVTCVNAMRLTLSRWEAEGRKVPPMELLDEAFDSLARGLKR